MVARTCKTSCMTLALMKWFLFSRLHALAPWKSKRPRPNPDDLWKPEEICDNRSRASADRLNRTLGVPTSLISDLTFDSLSGMHIFLGDDRDAGREGS